MPEIERRKKERRKVDRRFNLSPRENWYRDLILLVVIVFLWQGNGDAKDAAHDAKGAAHDAKAAIQAQKSGRAFSLNVVCGATNATVRAGRGIITGGSAGTVEGKFERNLRALGYPPRSVRQAQAKKAADLYASSIATGVQRAAGSKAEGIVREDGTLSCGRLVRTAVK